MVGVTLEIVLLLVAILGLFTKHFVLEQFLLFKNRTSKRDFLQVRAAVVAHCGSHGLVTTIILFPFWGWASLLLGLLDTIVQVSVKYWRSRTDWENTAGFSRLWVEGLEGLIFEIFYVSLAFLALTTRIQTLS